MLHFLKPVRPPEETLERADMTDYTNQVVRGLEAKANMKAERKTAMIRARAQYEVAIKTAAEDLSREAEVTYAQVLKQIHESGVPASVIRKEILGTNDWDTWTYWRDRADIEPDRITSRNARAEATERKRVWKIEDGVLYGKLRGEWSEMYWHRLSTNRRVGEKFKGRGEPMVAFRNMGSTLEEMNRAIGEAVTVHNAIEKEKAWADVQATEEGKAQ